MRNREKRRLVVRTGVIIALLAAVKPLAGLEAVDSLNPLYHMLPAESFSAVEGWETVRMPELPLSRTTGIFRGMTADGRDAGTVVHLVTTGYGGELAVLVAFDPSGTVAKVSILSHNETSCHVPGITDGSWLTRFVGIVLDEKLRLLVGSKSDRRGDIDAITGGTVSSRALTEAVAEARTAFFLVRSKGLVE